MNHKAKCARVTLKTAATAPLLALALVVWYSPLQAAPSADDEGSERGRAIYMQHCASCHGIDGRGKGPVAPALKAETTDLTMLAKRNNGKFPGEHVIEFIAGERVVNVHGTREMPVWGKVFQWKRGDDRLTAQLDIFAVEQYIKSIQQP